MRAVAVGSILPEPGDAGVDQSGVLLGQRLVVDAELVLHIRPIVLHQDVGILHQSFQHLDAARMLQIQGERALVAMQVLEVRAPAGPESVFGSVRCRHLNLDDVGAPVGELLDARRTGTDTGQIDHTQVRQGF